MEKNHWEKEIIHIQFGGGKLRLAPSLKHIFATISSTKAIQLLGTSKNLPNPARTIGAQATEVAVRAGVLNRMAALARPQSVRIA